MIRVVRIGILATAINLVGCQHEQQPTEPTPGGIVLTDLARRIRTDRPSVSVALSEKVYCGFPNECQPGEFWSDADLAGARMELGARPVRGKLREPLSRLGVGLVVAFGPVRMVAPNRAEIVVRYEVDHGSKIVLVSMTKEPDGWAVVKEMLISTATYIHDLSTDADTGGAH